MKLVNENFKEFLNETYKSYEELKDLVKDIINAFKNKNLDKKEIYLLKDIVDIKKYKNISIIGDVGIKIIGFGIDGGWINPNIMKKNEKYKQLYKKFKGLVISQLSEHGVFIHELQHAYDWYRNEGKAPQNYNPHDAYKSTDNFEKKYYRDISEQSAFFTEAINDTNFFDSNNNIRNINDVYKDFKEMYGAIWWGDKPGKTNAWKYLTVKMQKNLSRKFSQYYYKIKEKNI